MRMDKLTNQLQNALADAQSLALGRDNNFIEPLHLLAALLDQQGGSTRPLLQKAGADVARLKEAVQAGLAALPKVSGSGGDIHISNALGRILNLTDKLAQQGGDAYISTELVLRAMLESDSDAGKMLEDAGVSKAALDQAIAALLAGEPIQGSALEAPGCMITRLKLD